ncbi:MAG: hypothetical protein NXI28_15925 [bacterium]|nr:hypothetical protein [bacterium]
MRIPHHQSPPRWTLVILMLTTATTLIGCGPSGQAGAIHAIASETNTRLASHLEEVYGVPSPQRLTLRQASELIGKLKEQIVP